jgi:hypothetical protein
LEEKVAYLEKDSDSAAEVSPDASDVAWRDELMVAVINALYNQRSAGAYNMAKALEAKYFEGRDMREIGDAFVAEKDLYSAGRRDDT